MYRSHFEDFMLEIGEDPQQAHLCCVPRQGKYLHVTLPTIADVEIIVPRSTAHRYERPRASSEPRPMTLAQQSFTHAPADSTHSTVCGLHPAPLRTSF